MRIYQLLEMCAGNERALAEGRWQLTALATKFPSPDREDERTLLFRETMTLMYPERQPANHGGPVLVESAEA